MPAETLSAHVRRDTRIAYGYTTIEVAQATVGATAIVAALFVARHNQVWMVVTPLIVASLLLIGVRPHRPAYRTRTYRLRRDMRDGNIGCTAALHVIADGVDATWGTKRITRRRAARRWWGKQLGGVGQAAAVGLTVSACGAPFEYSLAASTVWLMIIGIAVKLEILLYVSAVHTLSLLPDTAAEPMKGPLCP